eukprot:COSAG02_NODE_34233_length_487_cov_1.025773_2_plen_50_part_01
MRHKVRVRQTSVPARHTVVINRVIVRHAVTHLMVRLDMALFREATAFVSN